MADDQENIKGLSWYPKYTGDYARKTRHLTMLEHGAYNQLLDTYFALGGPLSSNANGKAKDDGQLMPDHTRLYRLCGAITKAEQDAVDFVLSEFFVLIDSDYHNKKADETLEKQRALHENRAAAGRKGAKARHGKSNSKASGKAKAKPVVNAKHPEPEPEPIKNIYNKNDFLLFWDRYPRKIDMSDAEEAFIEQIEKGQDAKVILSATIAYALEQEGNEKKFIKSPVKFLDNEVFLEPEYSKQSAVDVDISDFPDWKRKLCKSLGVQSVISWFTGARLEGSTLIVNRSFSESYINNNYKKQIEQIGVKSIKVEKKEKTT